MANFLLIHGAAHGAWCWERVIPLLQDRGHGAAAIDLPGSGNDATPAQEVTLQGYKRAVIDAMGPETILVGHSLGGLSITLAAGEAPEQAKALVYLCALVPQPGQAFRDFRRDAISPAVGEAQTVDSAAGVTHVIPEKAASVFYSNCSDEDRSFALARLTPQPISVMVEPLEFDPPDCPKHYIRCLNDRVVFPSYQMQVSQGWANVHDMDCGHSPFLSNPEDLASLLDRIAAQHA